jgi:hypothetical protein
MTGEIISATHFHALLRAAAAGVVMYLSKTIDRWRSAV